MKICEFSLVSARINEQVAKRTFSSTVYHNICLVIINVVWGSFYKKEEDKKVVEKVQHKAKRLFPK